MQIVRLVIADDHPIVREGMKRIIADCPDMVLVGEAKDGPEAMKLCASTDPDVLLLDVSMPGLGFLETLRRIKLGCPEVRVLVLSVHPEELYAVRALRAGASGYLAKERSPTELAAAIRHIRAGRTYLTAELAEQLAAEIEPGAGKEPHELLSNREYQIFVMLGVGRSVSQIAGELCLSPKTVSTYRSRVLAKMKLRSNLELIRYAFERGLAA